MRSKTDFGTKVLQVLHKLQQQLEKKDAKDIRALSSQPADTAHETLLIAGVDAAARRDP